VYVGVSGCVCGCVYAYDVTRRDTFEVLAAWLKEVEQDSQERV